ncbi:DUF6934 family protein [Niastella populi]|uniref:Uncharacterized protein n=1 Tax=Niastella populi TaxID=550983 RepID=A0A1V9G365_9BACT|nr:hypothetical protein [Niastella populi]OQP65063.1 hypothetical protein A4R26_15255 [Niastella populi]
MKYEMYTELLVTSDYLVYEFASVGPKGTIPKIIQFSSYKDDKSIYNLAFGTKKYDGSLDDLARDNNNDRNKILATVVSVLRVFFDKYPDKWVYFTGSSPERTRLYRMAITLNLEELILDFEIVGTHNEEYTINKEPFEKGVNYFGFLVRPKNLNFKYQYKILLYEPEREQGGTTT